MRAPDMAVSRIQNLKECDQRIKKVLNKIVQPK